MADFMNWILLFFKNVIVMLFSLTSVDGFSLGYMLLAVAITGVVVSATVGAVALSSRMIKDNSYAGTSRARVSAHNAGVNRRLDNIEKGLYGD